MSDPEYIRRAIASIKAHEGFEAQPYVDTLGHWTVGYGHREEHPPHPSLRVTKHQAARWCRARVMDIDRYCKQYEPYVALSGPRKAVYIEMSYQLGDMATEKFLRMWHGIITGDFEDAAKDMVDSLWHRQTPERCEELARRMREDVYG